MGSGGDNFIPLSFLKDTPPRVASVDPSQVVAKGCQLSKEGTLGYAWREPKLT